MTQPAFAPVPATQLATVSIDERATVLDVRWRREPPPLEQVGERSGHIRRRPITAPRPCASELRGGASGLDEMSVTVNFG